MPPAAVFNQDARFANPADTILQVIRCADFELTGDGSNPEWDKTSWTTFDQRGSDAPYQTRFKILYSKKGIYCLYCCDDNKITATMQGENLDIYREDVVEAFFWTNEHVPVYFEYELSPLNYELVLMVPNYDGNFLGWIPWHYGGNRLTRHAVTIQHGKEDKEAVISWTGEFYIPYELMKPMVQAPPEKGTRWRANFYRIDYDKGPARWSWVPVKMSFHDYQRFGTLLFL
jgi:hypothetical protein